MLDNTVFKHPNGFSSVNRLKKSFYDVGQLLNIQTQRRCKHYFCYIRGRNTQSRAVVVSS